MARNTSTNKEKTSAQKASGNLSKSGTRKSAAARRRAVAAAPRILDDRPRRAIVGVGFIILGMVRCIAAAAPAGASVTDFLSESLHVVFGVGCYIMPFFLVAIGVCVVIHFAVKWLDKRNPHTQRITIVSMAFCFAMAYIAEQYFGIADITGAYIAGIVLCAMDDAPYVERRVDISNYVIFAPVFFASIGLKTDISGLTPEILLFCICFVIVALLTKIIGCGLAAKICRFNWGDSLKVGVGMMTRGEVALIVAQKGLEVGGVDPVYFTAVILLIVVSSVATPLALQALFTKMPPVPHPSQTKA